ncbi:MAG TPA: sulfatase-like hydrolase/transferase [Thermoanaerobaculia bacterium]|nr:sulfatase-like hydrolase/transferase [Thermoanaerobaculia bacterium]
MSSSTGRRTAARPARLVGLAAFVAVAAMAVAMAAAAAGRSAGAGAPAPAPPLDLVLVTIDTLRADAPGFGGRRPSPTPLLDRLAAGGRVFTAAHAHNVVTLPSHTNILTGLYPFQHGVRDNEGFRVPAGVPTLATVLHAAGYATGAFVGAYPLDSWFGLNRGFDVYDDHYPKGSHPDQFLFAERKGDKVVAPALAWWRQQRGRHRFMWVHLFDPHAPYEPAEPYASRFPANPYLGEVAAADGYLAPLLEPFLAGAETPTLIVVTGDHGESLGEHGEETHGLYAYEATLHVPLLLWGPGVRPGRDGRPARHVDIFPTLLEAAGLTGARAPAEPPGMTRPGRSLLASAGEAAETSYFEALSATFNRGWAPLRGVLRQGHKLIALPLPELYDLPHDPGEVHNLVDSDRQLARLLLARLPRESGAGSTPIGASGARREPTAAESANLRSLGYAGGSAPIKASYGPEDDPKRLIGMDRQIHQVIDLYQRRRPGEAAALARQLVAARPAMPLGHSLLAEALLQSGRKEEALAAMREAQRRGVASDDLLCQLGLTLAELGRPEEGVEVLRPLAERGGPQFLEALAQALSDAGRQQEAAAALRRALAIAPDDAAAYEEQGMVELRRERWGAARASCERALKLNDQLPRAWNYLGVALYKVGEPAAALDAWQRAVDLDGSLLDALWNLGTNAAGQGRPEQARRALVRFLELAPAKDYQVDREKARGLLRRLEAAPPAGGGGRPPGGRGRR